MQEEIHALLLAFAEAGATVIRLKGGDPYVFGRGGEEVQYLAQRGVQVHCVPGITAASGERRVLGSLRRHCCSTLALCAASTHLQLRWSCSPRALWSRRHLR